jgi:Fic family protein
VRRGATGTYAVSVVSGETVRAFVPRPLPPDPPLDLSGARQRLLEQALLACGRLDAITSLLPEPDVFLYSYVRREAVLSSQIEGTQSSLSDLLLFEAEAAPGVPFDDVVEVSNYVAALEHALQRLQEGFPLSNRLIREAHARLLSRGRGAEKQPGEFRTSQNWIGGTRPGNARFVPTPPEELPEGMAALERFMHDESDGMPVLVKAALAHVQFETLHPFLDGNGRVGRLLIALVLANEGILHQPLLYLSLYLKQHRDEYYRLLDQVRTEGDWESWLDFFLEGVHSTAQGAVDTAHRLVELFAEDGRRIGSTGRGATTALRVFDELRHSPVTSIPAIRDRTGLTYATVARSIETLEELHVVREVTGHKRNRVYAYESYLAVLNEGGEPL